MRIALTTTAALALLAFNGPAHAQAPSPDNLPRFQTTWQDVIKANGGFFATGVAQEFAYSGGPSGVTAVAPPSTNLIVNVRQIYGAAGEMIYLELLDGIRNVSFVRAYGDTFTTVAGGKATYARSSDWVRQAIIGDPLVLGWSYQNFAAWQTGLGQPNGSMGGASFGQISSGSSVPQTGSATFAGTMGAIWNSTNGQDRVVVADMGLAVNFGAHTADFWTTNTQIANGGGAMPDLDIIGTFLSLPNHPALFGTLNTRNLTGNSSAQFYGPAAQEVGGVFTLTPRNPGSLERLAGAFGGKLGTPVPPSAAPFTTWRNALVPAGRVGLAGQTTYLTRNTDNLDRPYEFTRPIEAMPFSLTLDAAGQLATLAISTPGSGDFNFSTAAGDMLGTSSVDSRFIAAREQTVAQNPKFGQTITTTNTVTLADPAKFAWDYQSFGLWENRSVFATAGSSATYVTNGVFTVGDPTPGASLPTSGTATFTGSVLGAYSRTNADHADVTGEITIGVSFLQNNAVFSTSSLRNVATGETYAGTAVNGWLGWARPSNALTGAAATTDGRMVGTASARFYGPQGQEIGGIYSLAPPSLSSQERLNAAFGAKR